MSHRADTLGSRLVKDSGEDQRKGRPRTWGARGKGYGSIVAAYTISGSTAASIAMTAFACSWGMRPAGAIRLQVMPPGKLLNAKGALHS
jgi:hypothetical protein